MKTLKRIELLERIERQPDRLSGKPCVRDTGISVETILGFLASPSLASLDELDRLEYLAEGNSEDMLLRAFPQLEREDVCACLAYAIEAVERLEEGWEEP